MTGRSSLERLVAGAGNHARFTIDQTQACIEIRVKTGGFHRFMFAFADRPDFLTEMAEQLIAHPRIDEMVGHLSSVLHSIHTSDPAAFRQRNLNAQVADTMGNSPAVVFENEYLAQGKLHRFAEFQHVAVRFCGSGELLFPHPAGVDA